MPAVEELYWDCAVCGGPQPLDVPPCADGHDDCPDRLCASCGWAFVVDPASPGRSAPDRITAPYAA
jgi:hypothetical protein